MQITSRRSMPAPPEDVAHPGRSVIPRRLGLLHSSPRGSDCAARPLWPLTEPQGDRARSAAGCGHATCAVTGRTNRTATSQLAHRAMETCPLPVVQRPVKTLDGRRDGHHREQHHIKAIQGRGKPAHVAQQRIGRAGTHDELGRPGRSQPQRVEACALLLGRPYRAFDGAQRPLIDGSRIGAHFAAPVAAPRSDLARVRVAVQTPMLLLGE